MMWLRLSSQLASYLHIRTAVFEWVFTVIGNKNNFKKNKQNFRGSRLHYVMHCVMYDFHRIEIAI